jgi:outer membrane protein assembly factor BamE (lipoprotein component of BamABCDE complex)
MLSILALFVLGACASAGNMVIKDETEQSVSSKIVEGKTTKQEIVATYGQPSQTTFTDGGNEIWTYKYAYAIATGASYIPIIGIFAGGANVHSKTLMIMFDRQDIVSRFSMREVQEEMKRGG